jgi:hypothetical protein
MKLNRRSVLAGAVAGAGAMRASAQTPKPDVQAKLLERALQNVYPMSFDGAKFSGAGWELLKKEGAASEFVLLGEEHGMHETPLLARELFLALRPAGFDQLAIEISPPIAQDLDRAARDGVLGIKAFIASHPPGPAFYFWKSEAELIAAARGAVSGMRDVLWGLDYEVTGDRRLIERLWQRTGSQKNALGSSLTRLDTASQDAWKTWKETKDPSVLFTFAGDPQLVRNVRAAWKKPDADVVRLLDTLEETLEINKLWTQRKGWGSNERRSGFMRLNLVAHLNAAAKEKRQPKVLVKMGESHVMRGVNWTGNFDVGSLAEEVAAMRGGTSFSLLVGGGKGSRHGVLNPTDFSTVDQPSDMLDLLGFGFLTTAVTEKGPMVVDMRPLRELVSDPGALTALNNPEAVRVIHSSDVLVIWNGSTATRMLREA